MFRSCVILTFILGITWIFGFILDTTETYGTETSSKVFNYAFIILNCSTGTFIFCYTVVLDSKMIDASKRAISKTSRRLSRSRTKSTNSSYIFKNKQSVKYNSKGNENLKSNSYNEKVPNEQNEANEGLSTNSNTTDDSYVFDGEMKRYKQI